MMQRRLAKCIMHEEVVMRGTRFNGRNTRRSEPGWRSGIVHEITPPQIRFPNVAMGMGRVKHQPPPAPIRVGVPLLADPTAEQADVTPGGAPGGASSVQWQHR